MPKPFTRLPNSPDFTLGRADGMWSAALWIEDAAGYLNNSPEHRWLRGAADFLRQYSEEIISTLRSDQNNAAALTDHDS